MIVVTEMNYVKTCLSQEWISNTSISGNAMAELLDDFRGIPMRRLLLSVLCRRLHSSVSIYYKSYVAVYIPFYKISNTDRYSQFLVRKFLSRVHS